MKTIEANGAKIPALGLGTWELRGDTCTQLVSEAIKAGYTHIDTAQMYQNEREVGEGIRASEKPRDELFVTTKIWPDNFAADAFDRAVDERLELLGVGAVDLLLLHWPSRTVPLAETMTALNKAKRAGHTRHIGISNFTVSQINEAVSLSDEPIVINQVEYHPLINQDKVTAACARHGISLTAYCPIARNLVADIPEVQEIAKAHNCSPAQTTLAWLMQQDDVIAIPRSSKPQRLADNMAATQVSLIPDEMKIMDSLKLHHKRLVDPESIRPDWDTV